jgi:uncharacterized protein YndB with AHSA1/START domain
MVQTERTFAVTREVTTQAKPETIFAFFTDPEKMVRWKGVSAVLDPRPGGTYRVDVTGGRDIAVGEYIEIDPPRRVVVSWGWEGSADVPPGSSLVEVDLIPSGEATLVRLTHSRLPAGADGTHGEGWEHYLPRLVDAAEGRDAGLDPWVGGRKGGH